MGYEAGEEETVRLSAAEKKNRLERAQAQLLAADPEIAPLHLRHKTKLAASFWGRAWCRHLEIFHELDYRFSAGRTLLRAGAVLDLRCRETLLAAWVFDLEFYKVTIRFEPLDPAKWARFVGKAQGQVSSLLDLLAGKVPDSLAQLIADPSWGLFPESSELCFSCTCLDHASLCVHVSACLYGIGVRGDESAGLFFALRRVNPQEIISGLASELRSQPGELPKLDLGQLFAIELE